VQDDSTGVWIRDPGRTRSGSPPDAVRIEAVIDRTSLLPDAFDPLKGFVRSEYAKVFNQDAPQIPQLNEEIEVFKKQPRIAVGLYKLILSVALCHPESLQTFLTK
jgi:hypothetical protein